MVEIEKAFDLIFVFGQRAFGLNDRISASRLSFGRKRRHIGLRALVSDEASSVRDVDADFLQPVYNSNGLHIVQGRDLVDRQAFDIAHEEDY